METQAFRPGGNAASPPKKCQWLSLMCSHVLVPSGPLARPGGGAVTGGIKAAVEQARAVADGKDVLLAGGVSIARQALAAGLVDEVVLHVVPKLIAATGTT